MKDRKENQKKKKRRGRVERLKGRKKEENKGGYEIRKEMRRHGKQERIREGIRM